MWAALSGLLLLALGPRAGVSTSPLEEVHPRAQDRRDLLAKTPSVIAATQGGQATGEARGPVIHASTDSTDVLSYTSTNEYDPITWSPWKHLAEPFRDTTLTANSTVGDVDNDVFTWSLEDGTTIMEGRSVKFTFKTLGKQSVSLTQSIVSTGETYTLDTTIMVKYVRREIRQLNENDREAFFDAMETLYRLPTAEGTAMYGDEYKGIHFFVQMHLDGAGVTDCDHWHDDAGIMTHHVGYTLLFEQALQVVNPVVTIPYWEYTIEASSGLDSYKDSEVFADDWFGTASPDNLLHTVDKGRWAYLPVMENAWDFVHNSYGLLRSPWNLDSTPYVTRHDKTNGLDATAMVTCSQYESCFDSTTLADLNNCLNGATHGPVHIKMGGEWNDKMKEFIAIVGYTAQVPLLTKILWRKGYLRTPTSCTAEEDGVGDASTCRASCPADIYKSRGMTEYDVLMDVMAIHWFAPNSDGTIVYNRADSKYEIAGHEDDSDFQAAFWSNMLASLCDPGHVGELYTSSAPYDPLFWVIHPTAERFLSWRRKLARESSLEKWALDETWGYTHGTVVGESGQICDWSSVEENTLDLPTCSKGLCGGHKVLDVLPFQIKLKGEMVKMSNIEWLAFIYPDNEDLPYMYNEFAWNHCVEEGYSVGTPSGE